MMPLSAELNGQPNPLDAETVRAIEAIILVAVEPVASEMLAQLLEQPVVMIERLCAELADAYAEAGHGFMLAKVAGGWRYQTHPELSPYVERFLLDGQRARMSGAALETLAIIAYRQPITKPQIEMLRGVNCDGVMATLEARNLVQELGRAETVGHPMRYGVSFDFLQYFGLKGTHELPAVEHLETLPATDTPPALGPPRDPDPAEQALLPLGAQPPESDGAPSEAPEEG